MLNYIILGVLQGIFEWIPVSSEGILALVSQSIIKDINPIDLALFLHLGTLLAVLFYFRKDWQEIITFKNPKLLRFLIITTIISLVVGFPFYKLIRNLAVGNTLLLITGFALLLTAYFHKKKRKLKIASNKLAVIAGFLQGLAVIPGLSRSGSTIFGLSLGKLDSAQILKISYMMSVPIILASSGYLILKNPILTFETWPSLVSSFLVGLISLHFLINFVKRINFFRFTLIFGLICILGSIIGFMV
jgi:undecaprenyl-diphosphatase